MPRSGSGSNAAIPRAWCHSSIAWPSITCLAKPLAAPSSSHTRAAALGVDPSAPQGAASA
jgi:hypothetical protein